MITITECKNCNGTGFIANLFCPDCNGIGSKFAKVPDVLFPLAEGAHWEDVAIVFREYEDAKDAIAFLQQHYHITRK